MPSPTASLALALITAGLCSCAAPHAYVGVQHVTPLAQVQDSKWPDNGSAYVNVLFPLGERWSLQIQPILPFDREQKPLLRVGVDYKLF